MFIKKTRTHTIILETFCLLFSSYESTKKIQNQRFYKNIIKININDVIKFFGVAWLGVTHIRTY